MLFYLYFVFPDERVEEEPDHEGRCGVSQSPCQDDLNDEEDDGVHVANPFLDVLKTAVE